MTGKRETLRIQKKDFKVGSRNVDWTVYGWLKNTISCRTFHGTNDETEPQSFQS